MAKRVEIFTGEAIAILNALPVDLSATFSYEHLSGGFWWTDEFPAVGSAEWHIVEHDYIYRFLIRIRRCITLGDASLEATPLWQQMLSDAPHWPGLLPKRRSGHIAKRLRAAERRAEQCLGDLEAGFDTETP